MKFVEIDMWEIPVRTSILIFEIPVYWYEKLRHPHTKLQASLQVFVGSRPDLKGPGSYFVGVFKLAPHGFPNGSCTGEFRGNE